MGEWATGWYLLAATHGHGMRVARKWRRRIWICARGSRGNGERIGTKRILFRVRMREEVVKFLYKFCYGRFPFPILSPDGKHRAGAMQDCNGKESVARSDFVAEDGRSVSMVETLSVCGCTRSHRYVDGVQVAELVECCWAAVWLMEQCFGESGGGETEGERAVEAQAESAVARALRRAGEVLGYKVEVELAGLPCSQKGMKRLAEQFECMLLDGVRPEWQRIRYVARGGAASLRPGGVGADS